MSDNGKPFAVIQCTALCKFVAFLKEVATDVSSKYALLWEAAVKSFEMHINKVAGNHKLSFEKLTTLMIGIEAVLDSRPLAAMSQDPQHILALTPEHFFRGTQCQKTL